MKYVPWKVAASKERDRELNWSDEFEHTRLSSLKFKCNKQKERLQIKENSTNSYSFTHTRVLVDAKATIKPVQGDTNQSRPKLSDSDGDGDGGETKSMDGKMKSEAERAKSQFYVAENGIVGEKVVESDNTMAMNQLLLIIRRHREKRTTNRSRVSRVEMKYSIKMVNCVNCLNFNIWIAFCNAPLYMAWRLRLFSNKLINNGGERESGRENGDMPIVVFEYNCCLPSISRNVYTHMICVFVALCVNAKVTHSNNIL